MIQKEEAVRLLKQSAKSQDVLDFYASNYSFSYACEVFYSFAFNLVKQRKPRSFFCKDVRLYLQELLVYGVYSMKSWDRYYCLVPNRSMKVQHNIMISNQDISNSYPEYRLFILEEKHQLMPFIQKLPLDTITLCANEKECMDMKKKAFILFWNGSKEEMNETLIKLQNDRDALFFRQIRKEHRLRRFYRLIPGIQDGKDIVFILCGILYFSIIFYGVWKILL